jgi:endonuclease/exonuclease/phosphatase family metal-dependent hydrolase
MRLRARSWATWVAAVAALALVGPVGGTAVQAKPINPDHPLTVMTRNVYLGANIMRPVRAATENPNNPLALPNAADQTWQVVEQTNFNIRAGLLADELVTEQPDLVGLQEVALWRTGPLQAPFVPGVDPTQIGRPNATTVRYDFLQILLDALAERGEPYTAISVQQEADVEAPSFGGVPPAIQRPQDIRLTMHDVILKRDDSDVDVVRTGSGQYDRRLSVGVAGIAMDFIRGYNWADVKVGPKKVRFINTHFEAFGSDHALAQAEELLAGPADVRGTTTVIACDCNSDPLDATVSNGVEHREPYQRLVGAGFADQWLQWAPAEQGWTSGLSERVNDATAAGFDHRIDLILARTPSGKPLGVTDGAITGDEVTDRHASGLWPSDHAGVVLTLAGKGD